MIEWKWVEGGSIMNYLLEQLEYYLNVKPTPEIVGVYMVYAVGNLCNSAREAMEIQALKLEEIHSKKPKSRWWNEFVQFFTGDSKAMSLFIAKKDWPQEETDTIIGCLNPREALGKAARAALEQTAHHFNVEWKTQLRDNPFETF
jgi:hypothetical protein